MRWIESNGGPFVVLPELHRSAWEGSAAPSGGRKVRAKFRWDDPAAAATDYDEACERSSAPHWRGTVRRPDFTAFVVPRGPKTFVPQRGGGILVHAETGTRRELEPHLGGDFAGVKWKRTRLAIDGGKLVMFDAAYEGKRAPAKARLAFELPRGRVRIDEADHQPSEDTFLVLYRFARL